MKPRMWHITSSTAHGSLTVQKLLEYVNGKTERSIEYREPIINFLLKIIFLGLIGFCGF